MFYIKFKHTRHICSKVYRVFVDPHTPLGVPGDDELDESA